jgi:NtrC-family two-component system response regulator AlgB
MLDAIELARQVATSQAPLLIRGEPGVGKGRLARAIHAWSTRAAMPFAAVSCELHSDPLEAELFGLIPSAAVQGIGRVAFCDGGTLFLDEISKLPAALQTKLVRLLHDKEYERMDEMTCRHADVRVIASTSVDLHQAVRDGNFRSDLLLALDIVQICIPPLRARPLDIPLLTQRYVAFFGKENHRMIAGVSSDAMYALTNYHWPGNVRELRNVIERAVLLCRSSTIGIEHLPPNLLNSDPAFSVGDLVPLETIEKSHVLQVVASTRSLRRAASILGIDSSTLCRWMKRYGGDDQPAA